MIRLGDQPIDQTWLNCTGPDEMLLFHSGSDEVNSNRGCLSVWRRRRRSFQRHHIAVVTPTLMSALAWEYFSFKPNEIVLFCTVALKQLMWQTCSQDAAHEASPLHYLQCGHFPRADWLLGSVLILFIPSQNTQDVKLLDSYFSFVIVLWNEDGPVNLAWHVSVENLASPSHWVL